MIKRIVRFFTAHVDGVLLGAISVLLLVGLLVLYSATGANPARITSQFVNIVVALAAMWIVANVSPQHLMRLALPVYVVGLALVVCVALFGDVANGARRWLHVGVTRIQPSEVMKIAMPLMLAWYFHRYEAGGRRPHYAVA